MNAHFRSAHFGSAHWRAAHFQGATVEVAVEVPGGGRYRRKKDVDDISNLPAIIASMLDEDDVLLSVTLTLVQSAIEEQ